MRTAADKRGRGLKTWLSGMHVLVFGNAKSTYFLNIIHFLDANTRLPYPSGTKRRCLEPTIADMAAPGPIDVEETLPPHEHGVSLLAWTPQPGATGIPSGFL